MAVDPTLLLAGDAAYFEALWERYQRDPHALSEPWAAFFADLTRAAAPATVPGAVPDAPEALVEAFRAYGYQLADTDPLQLRPRPPVPELEQSRPALVRGSARLEPPHPLGRTPAEVMAALRAIYTGPIGAEIAHLPAGPRAWWARRLEAGHGRYGLSDAQLEHALAKLAAAEALEKAMQTRFPGHKRFSLEGAETLIPMLERGLRRARAHGVQAAVLGMAHRGRLNLMVNLLGKPPRELFAAFEHPGGLAAGSGDVKYHLGMAARWRLPEGELEVVLAYNPSHLEAVDPVVEGMARARQDQLGDRHAVLPVLLHGDAAVAGQGVVAETLNLARLRGFETGGTLHVVINNQVGFSVSDPRDARSSASPADVARVIAAPILHVNGDDPEAACWAVDAALDYRDHFGADVFVDLVCWRRYGHNEADEPRATQPGMYRRIDAHPGILATWARRLMAAGRLEPARLERLRAEAAAAMESAAPLDPDVQPLPGPRARARPAGVDTRVGLERLQGLAQRLVRAPEGLELHRQIQRLLRARSAMAQGEAPLDWGFAEQLALASLLVEGHPVRLCGQDVGRGTFFQRHAVWHGASAEPEGAIWVPLAHLAPDQAPIEVVDSTLSELAVLGFEYGYSVAAPEVLVLWEAQYGDFANAAQVVIDQFLAAGASKWGQTSDLVLLLPHGQEGQGPEHSSGRLERYLQLAAEDNLTVVVPSTPAQIFHLLRHQALARPGRPLVVMTPKSLLRHPRAVSTLNELAHGEFAPVLGDPAAPRDGRRVVLCSGKLYWELLDARERQGAEVALVRLEQLYPLPEAALREELARFPGAEVRWVQEEPRNQGAWLALLEPLGACLRADQHLVAVTRPAAAAPAVGDAGRFRRDQDALIAQALAGASLGLTFPEQRAP